MYQMDQRRLPGNLSLTQNRLLVIDVSPIRTGQTVDSCY